MKDRQRERKTEQKKERKKEESVLRQDSDKGGNRIVTKVSDRDGKYMYITLNTTFTSTCYILTNKCCT